MSASFHDIQFPPDISVGAVGGPEFKTTILTLGSGEEKRNIEWSMTRGQYNVGTGIRRRVDFEEFQQFFYARYGRAYGFRFKDWSDYFVEAQSFTVGVDNDTGPGGEVELLGGNTQFQLYKRYQSGAFVFIRPLLKPVLASAEGTREIKVNGVVIPESAGGSHYNIDYTTGLLTFNFPLVDDDVVEIVYLEFDVPVRFDIDKLDMNMLAYEAGEWMNVPIIELKNAN